MFTVAEGAELPRGFRLQPLMSQFGSNGFDVVLRQFVSETGCTIRLIRLSECLMDGSITDEP